MEKGKRILAFWMLVLCLAGYLPVHADADEVHLTMETGVTGQKTGSFSVGQPHPWYIRAKVNDGWEGITILQTLPPELTLDVSSVGAYLSMENGERILLRMEEHYLLTAGSVYVEGGTADRLCISLTPEGIAFLSEYGARNADLVVVYTARINAAAQMGRQIIGIAQMNLTDSKGKRFIHISDKAAVSTGGLHLRLSDGMGDPLRGGEFMLAREATDAEREYRRNEIEILDTGAETIAVLYERFYTANMLHGEKSDLAVTDEEGRALCYGLAYGTYYLVQTKSAREDILPSKPLKIQINEVSHLTAKDNWTDSLGNIQDNTIRITGTQLVMPNTGGPGSIPYTVLGTAVIFCACLLLWYNRKQTVFT